MQKQEFDNAVLFCGDCAEVLPQVLAENTVGALIADPPYILQATGGNLGGAAAIYGRYKQAS